MANAEIQTISKLCETKDLGFLIEEGVDSSWFLGYRSTWEFIIQHNQDYGSVPSAGAILSQFPDLELPAVDESLEWAIDRLKNQLLRYSLKALSEKVLNEVDEADPNKLLLQVVDSVYALSVKFDERKDQDIIHDYASRLDKTEEQVAYYTEYKKPKAISVGFDKIDNKAPFVDGNLITFIGDTGSFKSYIIQWMAMHAVFQKHVAIASLEMTKHEVGWRIDSIYAHHHAGLKLSNSGLSKGSDVDLGEYRAMLEKRAGEIPYGLWVSDTAGSVADVTSSQIIAKFDHYVRKFRDDFGLFIVDYTSLLDDANDWNDLKQITRKLKMTAQRLGKPCIQIAQAKRGARNREIRRDDIGYAWGMVEDSDTVFTITREDRKYIRILCDKARGNEEGWGFMIMVDPDLGIFQVTENANAHAF